MEGEGRGNGGGGEGERVEGRGNGGGGEGERVEGGVEGRGNGGGGEVLEDFVLPPPCRYNSIRLEFPFHSLVMQRESRKHTFWLLNFHSLTSAEPDEKLPEKLHLYFSLKIASSLCRYTYVRCSF